MSLAFETLWFLRFFSEAGVEAWLDFAESLD
jgi:hypothetical protein